ncbi:GGDEF domain-containing protein [Xenophilus sp. Marseille-Q4582]|uniref:sensor domain-containing diguanylate cyclase n=1 Tax=Xenophilus sp. Marseille-Q4582 TaxID=2866600 RepID=UPI001CE47EB1|nr:GGDEF domain-containing protein [Xenophilus sp. Marseille-Q4582]
MTPSRQTDFEQMFDRAPISLWLEDFSALKALFDGWRATGVTDLQAHLEAHPSRVQQCAACLRLIKVNAQTLKLFAARSQEELEQNLHDVFRGDMLTRMLPEMLSLWNGRLDYSNQTVNYALDGRRIEAQIHVRVLQGHEANWDRVLISLEDVTETVVARQQLAASERHARNLFDYSPVSLWVEDFSGVKRLLDEARAQGIQDFRVFLSVHPEFVSRCMQEIRVLEVNRQTLQMFGAQSQEELLANLSQVFRDEMHDTFAEQLVDLWNGKTEQTREVINYSLGGSLINIHMQFSVMPEHLQNWDLVLLSLVDITARKKAEAYLEYLGKHDSLTRLRNRAFYVDELNRISRKGPWPLSALVMDLNGLKRINDSEGHVAGDALLRRAGEVLSNATAGQPWCVARVGGDEFVALLPGADERMAQEIRARIESLIDVNNQFYPGHPLSMAIGVASAQQAGEVEAALHAADQAMFEAKALHYEALAAQPPRRAAA